MRCRTRDILLIGFMLATVPLPTMGRAAPPPADCPTYPPSHPATGYPPPPMFPSTPTPAPISTPTVEPHESGTSQSVRFRADTSGTALLVQHAQLLASDGVPNPCHAPGRGAAGFGRAVALSGDGQTAAVIGAAREGLVAYVFVRDGAGWREQAKLVDPADARTGFSSVPVINRDGSMIVVGEPGANKGRVFIFVRHDEQWDLDTTLVANDGAVGDEFGFSVAMSADGGTLSVAAIGREKGSGAVYLFTHGDVGWTQRAILLGRDRALLSGFGRSVALSADGTTAVVGTVGNADLTGSVYVFARNGDAWDRHAIVTPDDYTLNERFGDAVAISGDGGVIVVGAPNRMGTATGGAYILIANGSVWGQQLLTERVVGINEFGIAVAISADGTHLFIGAREENARIGAVYRYQHNTDSWQEPLRLTASDGDTGDDFGIAVAVSADGATLVVGSPHAHDLTGAVYIFGTPTV